MTPRSKPATPLSKKRVRKILWGQGFATSLTTVVCERIQTNLALTNSTLINDGKLWNEVVIRASSFHFRGPSFWNSSLSLLRAKHTGRYQGTKGMNDAGVPEMTQEHLELLDAIRTDCHGSFRERWKEMTAKTRAQVWQQLALWLLEHEPTQIPGFLLVSLQDGQRPDMMMVTDCLKYIDRFYYNDWLRDWRDDHHNYQSLIDTCLSPITWPVLNLSQKSVHFFLKRASFAGIKKAFVMTKHRQHRLAPSILLSFMYRFIEHRNVGLALAALDRLVALQSRKYTLDSQGVRWHCSKLLLLDTVEETAEGRNFRILPSLLQMGVLPDQTMMNIVLSNAFKTGDSRIGMDMLQFMKNFDHQLDHYTYLALISEALVRGDRARVNALIVEIESKEEILRNPYITSKLVYAHYVFNAKGLDADEDPQRAFYVMLDSYTRFHDITPLRLLGIVPPTYIPREGSFNITPVPSTLFTMLATYVRCDRSLADVERVYAQFRALMMEGHPTFTALVRTDHFYNEFLRVLRGNPHGVQFCVQVVRDMLEAAGRPMYRLTRGHVTHVAPTIRTWTLLLSNFIYSGHTNAGERIQEMMARYNVKYDQTLWNVVISGYATSQQVPQIAATIKAMEQAGFTIDIYTLRHLRYLRNPDQLRLALEELDRQSAPKRSLAQISQSQEDDDGSDRFPDSFNSPDGKGPVDTEGPGPHD